MAAHSASTTSWDMYSHGALAVVQLDAAAALFELAAQSLVAVSEAADSEPRSVASSTWEALDWVQPHI